MKSLILIIICTIISASSFAFEDNRVTELIQKSKTTRIEVKSTFTNRDLASLNEAELKLNNEYDQLMKNDSDTDWFKKVDTLIED
ncbi:MAG: hypothetical protein HOJ35_10105 [Bdellovibrionales bacterium]|jgi:hypothetical protein|nr:hypothetical protein [Bdellovibrionales bacterium]